MSGSLNNVVKELAQAYKNGGLKTTRFSITIAEKDNARLETLSDNLEISKQELISKLLVAALDDLEREIYKKEDDEGQPIDISDMTDDDLPF